MIRNIFNIFNLKIYKFVIDVYGYLLVAMSTLMFPLGSNPSN